MGWTAKPHKAQPELCRKWDIIWQEVASFPLFQWPEACFHAVFLSPVVDVQNICNVRLLYAEAGWIIIIIGFVSFFYAYFRASNTVSDLFLNLSCLFFELAQETSLDQGFLWVLRGSWRTPAQWVWPSLFGLALELSQPSVLSAMQSWGWPSPSLGGITPMSRTSLEDWLGENQCYLFIRPLKAAVSRL